MRILSSSFSRKELILKKGTVCCNCQKDKGELILFHHIVPLSIGGKDLLTNIVPICDDCHQLIHHNINEKGQFKHSELIKAGLKKAKDNGVHLGRKNTGIEDIPDILKNFYYPKIKNKTISIAAVAREMKMSRTTIYKYISIIENTV
jgi:predicted transcriptional regulator YheO